MPLAKSPVIVEMTPDEVDAVWEIEVHSFPSPWSKNLFLKELRSSSSRVFIAKADLFGRSGVVGYLCLWLVSEEAHILNLATHPEYRRQGVAHALLTHGLAFAWQKGTKRVFLDVRETNYPAQALYQHHGFTPIGMRKGYYSDTKEDAIVMMLEMGSPSFLEEISTSRTT